MTDSSQQELLAPNSLIGYIDFDNRDPKGINEDTVKVKFEDIIAEPSGSHSLRCVWEGSNYAFRGSKYCCYRCLTAVLAIPLSLIWGFHFACLSFFHIWTVVPCIKSCVIQTQCLSQLHSNIIHTFIDPFFEAIGKMYGGVKVLLRKET